MVKHIVMWRFKEEFEGKNKKENCLKVKELIESLKEKIDGIISLEVGINFEKSDQAFDIVLNSVFESNEALQAYQIHPEHVKVADFIKKIVKERSVVDYK
ncbi:Dabb family protein [Clostridium sp. Marseille-Q2269]|uniref:Dabb family protein n=1 Tax=Clostridium sp. Marseille-Q2269 TaxID=2942205 RepID=UPI002073B549|nr:Dabb family protein [Clostridium sp. Marseille-Q2269]